MKKKGDKLMKGKTDLMPVMKRDEGNVKKADRLIEGAGAKLEYKKSN